MLFIAGYENKLAHFFLIDYLLVENKPSPASQMLPEFLI